MKENHELKRKLRVIASRPHEALGIARGASEREIHRAFRRLALRFHPDKNQYTTVLFQSLQLACENAIKTPAVVSRRKNPSYASSTAASSSRARRNRGASSTSSRKRSTTKQQDENRRERERLKAERERKQKEKDAARLAKIKLANSAGKRRSTT